MYGPLSVRKSREVVLISYNYEKVLEELRCEAVMQERLSCAKPVVLLSEALEEKAKQPNQPKGDQIHKV